VLRPEGPTPPDDAPRQAEGGWRPAIAGASWRKSSLSTYNGNCVEVAHLRDGRVGVRDTKDREAGPVLIFSSSQWGSFLAGAKAGRFDIG